MEYNKKVLKLRPHHLICIQGFQGYGYSKIFTEHLKGIIDGIKNSKFQSIQIIKGCDNICSKCCWTDVCLWFKVAQKRTLNI